MIFANEYTHLTPRPRRSMEAFVLLLAPFAPHLAEELWQRLGHAESLAYAPWPAYDEALTRDPEVELAVQVNGKVRDKITVAADADEAAVQQAVMASDRIQALLEGKTIRKVIVIKGRLVNIVAT
jgi:leucyl-tRNA synthetase